jgi:uncharacterized membrane protein
MFGIVAPGTTVSGGWALAARLIAGSFLFLVGVSLVLVHEDGIRWRGVLRRAVLIGSAALAVSLATWIALPERFIYFGILHAILAASLAGVFLVERPTWVALLAAIAVIGLWYVAGRSLAIAPGFGWTGLAADPRPSLDLVPLVPWLAPAFAGIAFAKLFRVKTWHRNPGPLIRAMGWPGRHALTIYLVHQPVIIALLWLATRLFAQ